MKKKQIIISLLGVVFVLYLTLSTTIFRIRHPYLTETEQFIHIFDALSFNKIGEE